MEIGAVIAAAPAENVRRERPIDSDIVILLGGRTGRDGCGGATGSSKSHTLESLESCGAEVQKGNAPEERKLQRLFRNPEASKLIKRCNDFGAGGVSVAIGELADGLEIDLNAVPKIRWFGWYRACDFESQERMAVVVAAEDVARFKRAGLCRNLEATVVAKVTEKALSGDALEWQGDCKYLPCILGFQRCRKAYRYYTRCTQAFCKNPADFKKGYLALAQDFERMLKRAFRTLRLHHWRRYGSDALRR